MGFISPGAIRFSALKAYVQAKSIHSSLNTVVPVFTKLFEKIQFLRLLVLQACY